MATTEIIITQTFQKQIHMISNNRICLSQCSRMQFQDSWNVESSQSKPPSGESSSIFKYLQESQRIRKLRLIYQHVKLLKNRNSQRIE